MSAAAAVAAASQRRQREIVAAFAGAGAVDAEHARTAEELGVRDRLHAMRHLQDRGVLHLAAAGRYWVDLAAWQALRHRRRRIALVIALIAALAALLASGALAAWLPAVIAR
jgi:hypothetical protein